jgi:hypothetical protein
MALVEKMHLIATIAFVLFAGQLLLCRGGRGNGPRHPQHPVRLHAGVHHSASPLALGQAGIKKRCERPNEVTK